MRQEYAISAHYVKNSLNLAKIAQRSTDLQLYRKERNALIYRLSETQYVAAYAFGVVLFFGKIDRKEMGRQIRFFSRSGEEEVGIILAETPSEEYLVIIEPETPESVEFDDVRLKSLNIDRLLLVFHTVAQSVAIDFLDRQVEDAMQRFERIHFNLSKRGSLVATTKEVLQTIGMRGNIVNLVVGQLSLLDKPDIAWEDKEAETLIINLRKNFELDDRFNSLKFKLEFIEDSSELILDILQHRRANLLEITVVLLILFEIIMAFVRH